MLPDVLPHGTGKPEALQNQGFRRGAVDVEAAGSNPVTPIFLCKNIGFSGVGQPTFKQTFVLPGVTSRTQK